MPRIALVTARAARELDEDLLPLANAVRALDAEVDIVAWDDTDIDWSRFDIALLRSTWDYTQRLPEFLDWANRAATQTRLLNPLEVVRWNTDKHYLGALAQAGVSIVPSVFVEPGENAANALEIFLASPAMTATDTGEFVVKPCIGAGSRDAQRHVREQRAVATAHVRRLLDAGRSVLLQPYLDRVDEHGETALIHFDGVFSHAIRKGPLLRRGEGPTRALFAAEAITPRTPTVQERAFAERTLAAIPFAQPLAYARVDLIQDNAGLPCLLELELIEPSLFFEHAADSATRFARVLLARARQSR
jgi:glutathione synthase/RimK-type ligase-like ATP-grasp enzyme